MSKELIGYLEAQIELGGTELYFPEAFEFSLKPTSPPPSPVHNAPSTAATPPSALSTPSAAPPLRRLTQTAAQGGSVASIPEVKEFKLPPPMVLTKKYSWEAIENCAHLDDYYNLLSEHPLYKSQDIAKSFLSSNNDLVVVSFNAPQDLNKDQYLPEASEKLLHNMFKAVNIDYSQCVRTYLIKKPLSRAPVTRELRQYSRLLIKELNLLQAKMVILLGENTLQGLLGRGYSLEKNGGEILKEKKLNNELQFIPLLDPLSMLKNPQLKHVTWRQHFPRSVFFNIP